MLPAMRRIPADVLLLICVVSWGLNFTVTKYAQQHGFAPLGYAAPRLVMASVLVTTIAYWRERSLRVDGPDLRRLMLVGGVVVFGNQLSFAFSFHFASAAVVALLFGTMPIVAVLISAALGLEQIRALKWAAAAVSFAGVAMVAVGAGGGTHSNVAGILLGLTSPTTFVAYSIALAPLVRRYGTYRVNALASLMAVMPLLAVSAPTLVTMHWSRVSALAWLCLIYSAAAYGLPNLLWFAAIDRVGTPRATLWANLQPFAGTMFALLILSEQVSALTFVGGGVLAAGIVISRLSPRSPAVVVESGPAELALAVTPPHE
jgi:drug/metabolite transporter (DMT)-like permease